MSAVWRRTSTQARLAILRVRQSEVDDLGIRWQPFTLPRRRTILAIRRMPLSVDIDHHILDNNGCRSQDVVEVAVDNDLLDLERLLADRTEPFRRLLHHAEPARSIETLRVHALD